MINYTLKDIDVNFDFTTDTPHYWDDFREKNDGMGSGNYDPDTLSKTLQRYHQLLWSKKLPNGEYMELERGSGANYLTWKNFRFGSDSITASFRYKRYSKMLERIQMDVPNFRDYIEKFIRKSYTIGGTIIFPKRKNGINSSRGLNRSISDRWDLTLECIRRYYMGEESPLYETLIKDKAFFDLFVDFKGYVDYFFLQDCVTSDYSSVNFWLGNGEFYINPLPKSTEEYLQWIENEIDFVEKRNGRIQYEIYNS
ncbi:MAG: DUF6994 family protein [Ruminococcus sp.]